MEDLVEDIVIDQIPEVIDYSTISVQILYRPVLRETVPDCPPLDRNNDAFKWWQEQINRCLYGWIAPDGHYLNGYLYFYLNFVKVKLQDPETEVWDNVPPLYRDNDEEIFNIIWGNKARRLPNGKLSQARNHVEAKPRGIAWTTLSLLGVGLYTFVFEPENPIGNAYPNPDQVGRESVAFQTSWEALHPMFRRWKGKQLTIVNNSSDLFSVGEKIKGNKIKRLHNRCMFHVIGTESAGVYKGDRMHLMIAVEAGLWKGDSLKNYINENEPCIASGKSRWGMTLIGGTSNLIINKTTAYKDIFESPKIFKATCHFTPSTKVLRDHIDYHTGRSLVEKALETIQAKRDEKLDDPVTYQQLLMEYPLTPEEAFIPNLQLAYNSATINNQISKVKTNYLDTLWRRGILYYEKDVNGRSTGVVKFTETGDGDWLINMEGLPNQLYENLHIAAIDDRYKSRNPNKKVDKDASRNAMVIYRQPTMYPIRSDMPVGLYLGNDADMTVAYEEFYKGMLFWNIKQTLYEYNADGFIIFLRTEKKDLQRLYFIDEDPGIKVTPKIKNELTYLGNQYFNDGRYQNCTCVPILESLLIWGGATNTDIGSAFHLVLLLLHLTKDSIVTILNENKINQGTYIMLGQNYNETEYHSETSTYLKMGRRVA
ncbi:hypothetical protein [Dyadobacter sp. CY312]|uniref:hypothetical protein n=1 Tax=Dyadobacter sp. CY312 TaxID=2907303 RepID=UPI001F23FE1E|nr:hypothetical protein [Dyadobacter sp. CY312]MCE7039245.1 hypothetical protein [Dyadobacter sp. CY312]